MQVINESKAPIKAWIDGVELEEEAKKQLLNLANMPFIHKHVAVMPDCHAGIGATVGSVIATKGAIIPASVGVDVGCGCMAVKINLKAHQLPDNLSKIRSAIEMAVPHGRTDNGGANDRGAWGDIPSIVQANYHPLAYQLSTITAKHAAIEKAARKAAKHLGTLGTGNHFIELCLDENQDVWIMLHSGSRGIGNKIGSYFIELAKEDMRRWFINLPDMDLAYLPEGSEHFNDYLEAVSWAQDYALMNRKIMRENVMGAISGALNTVFSWGEIAVNCHHNYVTKENHFGANVWVTRKGAVRAQEKDLGIIPGSMGAKSFIVRGKGNKDSFQSCSHGAGRRMSRTKARKIYTVEDHIEATKGVECRKDVDVIDETPMAYKNIDNVMAAQSDLVEVVHTLKQIVCVKG